MTHARYAPMTKRAAARLALGWASGGALLATALAGTMALQAQSLAAHDTSAPVTFDAGSIDFDDRLNRVVLTGGVTVEQGALTVRSQRMLANYTDDGALDVNRITANGSVIVTRGNERATGDVAVYDFSRRIITMSGNVELRRGGDALRGGRLVIDLRTGLSSVDGRTSGSGSRVSGTFSVPQN
ncbi:MAG: LptA/OstA family protein [Pseudomonadota bacterium]